MTPVSIDGKGGTGRRVPHTIVDGGKFAATYDALATRDDWHGLNFNRIDEITGTAKTQTGEEIGPEGQAADPGQVFEPLRIREHLGQTRPHAGRRDRRLVGRPHGPVTDPGGAPTPPAPATQSPRRLTMIPTQTTILRFLEKHRSECFRIHDIIRTAVPTTSQGIVHGALDTLVDRKPLRCGRISRQPRT